MYARTPQGRFPRDVHVPKNYAGTAFRAPHVGSQTVSDDKKAYETESLTEQETRIHADGEEKNVADAQRENDLESAKEREVNSEAKQSGLFSSLPFRLGTGKLFSRGGGISLELEDLLLIGLILLMLGESKSDELWLLLLLLLFVQ